MVLSRLFSEKAHRPFTVPQGSFRFVALDVETANSDSSSICQIGLACVDLAGSITVASTLIDPRQPYSTFNSQLHGIDVAKTRGAPHFGQIFPLIAPLLADHLIFQHSAFDRRAVYGACKVYGIPEPDWTWADSVRVARKAWPEFKGQGGHGLAHLKEALGLEFQHHDAGEDAKAAAQVVLHAERATGEPLEALIAPASRKAKVARSKNT